MKILMVNKFFYIKGGSETYYFALKRKLEKEGHIVIDFSMKDKKNFESKYADYFVDNVDYSGNTSLINKLKMGINIIYSQEAKRKFEELVIKTKPDIVHLHIFQHQLSPSILDVCKKYNLPTVYTAHDLKMVCLNYKMMHHGHVCEDCKDGHMYHCALNKCVKDSFSKSFINTVEGYLHKWRKIYDAIDYIITPSEFYKTKFEEFGVQPNRLVHIPNFLDREVPRVNNREDKEKYYLYFGRLSEEKGILTLIKAIESVKANLYIVGSGPLKEEIESYTCSRKLKNIKLLGFKSGQELIDIVGNAKAVILPSEWYENGPYSAIEALQVGRPIIGANIGGIPELVRKNGELFTNGCIVELSECINKFEKISKAQYEQMKKDSFDMFEECYTPNGHYGKLMKIYEEAQRKHGE